MKRPSLLQDPFVLGNPDGIKPCPFCGKQPVKENASVDDDDYYWLFCFNPKCTIQPQTEDYRTMTMAIKNWNRRKDEKS